MDWGDLATVDWGFDIVVEMPEIGVKVIIPPFLKYRDRFTPQEEILMNELAKVKIFVEDRVRRMKKFHIFSQGA